MMNLYEYVTSIRAQSLFAKYIYTSDYIFDAHH